MDLRLEDEGHVYIHMAESTYLFAGAPMMTPRNVWTLRITALLWGESVGGLFGIVRRNGLEIIGGFALCNNYALDEPFHEIPLNIKLYRHHITRTKSANKYFYCTVIHVIVLQQRLKFVWNLLTQLLKHAPVHWISIVLWNVYLYFVP